MEKGCKWHFGCEGGSDKGPNDSIHQIFHGNKHYYIVRESIQNSLDAIDKPEHPVQVVFSFEEIDISLLSNFLDIENHIKSCKSYYAGNEAGNRLFDRMLLYINDCRKKGKISCLKISDYNTKGMSYSKNDTNCSFYAFLRAEGVSSKAKQGSGGSFGFGKGAYFALSPLKSLIVSSLDTEGNANFEGGVRITTHLDPDNSDSKLSNCGYYDNNAGEPITKRNDIPQIFSRETSGTDIYIMGLYSEADSEDYMIKSVLNNFWLAIHDRELEVQINGTLISSDNLEETVNRYFADDREKNSVNDIISWNPRPYYKSVKYVGSTKEFKVIEDDLKTLGKVKLYLYLDNNLPNRIAYFRKAKMVVFKQTDNILNGYAGVFLCEDKKGNGILRELENPAHNEWNIKNYPELTDGQENPIGRQALDELKIFVRNNLKKLSDSSIDRKTTFLDLENYLSIPEDLIDDDEFENEGETSNSKSGIATSEESEEETGNQTTNTTDVNKQTKVTIKPKIKQPTLGRDNDDAGEYTRPGGGENESEGGDIPGAAGGEPTGADSTPDKKIKRLIRVGFKQVAQIEDNQWFHYLMINSAEKIDSAEIELMVGGDSNDELIPIVYSARGKIKKENSIVGLTLIPGNNTIRICFSDNMKHTLKIQAYEIRS